MIASIIAAPSPAEACVAADMSCMSENRVKKPANGTTRLRNLSSCGTLVVTRAATRELSFTMLPTIGLQ
jgi:hypothetical protein